jgi:uncharacterized protein involved in high-affinity Fe2+ transport
LGATSASELNEMITDKPVKVNGMMVNADFQQALHAHPKEFKKNNYQIVHHLFFVCKLD